MLDNSCFSQSLSITHEICKSSYYNPPVDITEIFLDISKAFDKVWHEGVICKLQTYSINGNWKNILAGVLQGSDLELLTD